MRVLRGCVYMVYIIYSPLRFAKAQVQLRNWCDGGKFFSRWGRVLFCSEICAERTGWIFSLSLLYIFLLVRDGVDDDVGLSK